MKHAKMTEGPTGFKEVIEGSGLTSATSQPKINLQTAFMNMLKPRKPLGSRWSGDASFYGTEYFILEIFIQCVFKISKRTHVLE